MFIKKFHSNMKALMEEHVKVVQEINKKSFNANVFEPSSNEVFKDLGMEYFHSMRNLEKFTYNAGDFQIDPDTFFYAYNLIAGYLI